LMKYGLANTVKTVNERIFVKIQLFDKYLVTPF
jgi:hypothetical protein